MIARRAPAPVVAVMLVAVMLVAVMLVAVMLVAGAVTPARAAPWHPAPPAASRLSAAVTEGTKVVLPETSIAGPGFDGLAIAWTGTDAAHHLNVAVGPDGLHFPDKTILPETSPFAPAIASVFHEPGRHALAWTGSDANHSLNVQLFPGGTKLTLRNERGLAAPALDFGVLQNVPTLLLAWTGTDPNHSLNVLPLAVGKADLTPGPKAVLGQFSSDAGPSVVGNTSTHMNAFVLGWTTRAARRLNLATAADGAHFASALGAGLPQTSAAAPQFAQPGTTSASDGCIAWTGTDPANHLNVQCTTSFPQFPNPAQTKAVLGETVLGAPGFSFDSVSSHAEIAWTGTDPAHHLNVAQLTLP